MSRRAGGSAPPSLRSPWIPLKILAWRASIIGLALHVAVVLAGSDDAPTAERIIPFMAAALALGMAWSRARPAIVPNAAGWDRAVLEAAAVGPAAALFAFLLGWAAATGVHP